jgi:predicted amidohydrolase
MSPRDDLDENLAKVLERCSKIKEGTDVIVLPEMWSFMVPDARSHERREAALRIEDVNETLKRIATEHRALVVGGTSFAPAPDGKVFNRCSVFSPAGESVAQYDKVHMFDQNFKGGAYRESESVEPGKEVVCFEHQGLTMGLSICYDLRFPYHFQALREMGASLMFCPAAFTAKTGHDHWKVLVRARAIENQAFLIANDQCDSSVEGVDCHGHSMVVDPWGEVLLDMGRSEGLQTVTIDLGRVQQIRQQMPIFDHIKHSVLESRGHK